MTEQQTAEQLSNEFYEGYDDPAADIVLESVDGKRFAIPSVILKYASDVFAGMLDFPQPARGAPLDAVGDLEIADRRNVIKLEEHSDVLAHLLNVITPGREGPQFELLNFEDVEDVAKAADKYNLPNVTLAIQRSFHSKQADLYSTPLSKYLLSRRLGWKAEETEFICDAQATNHSIDVYDFLVNSEELDFEGAFRLVHLRWRRKAALERAFSLSERVAHKCPNIRIAFMLDKGTVCADHSRFVQRSEEWLSFKEAFLRRFEEDEKVAESDRRLFWKNRAAVNTMKLKKCPTCQHPMVNVVRLCKELNRIVKHILPKNLACVSVRFLFCQGPLTLTAVTCNATHSPLGRKTGKYFHLIGERHTFPIHGRSVRPDVAAQRFV